MRLLRWLDGTGTEVQPWSRRKIVRGLAAAGAVAVLLAAGLVYNVITLLTGDEAQSPTEVSTEEFPVVDGVRGDEYRDQVASSPMLEFGEDDLEPAPPSVEDPGTVEIGPATEDGPANIPTGFNKTPEGALAQLGALASQTLTPLSVRYADAVYEDWAIDPEGFEQWPIVQAIQSFHGSAGTVEGDGSIQVDIQPAAGQIKATDGPDWVVACVLLDVSITVNESTRFGFGHCERMEWVDDRWRIAADEIPAVAPSTWPGSERSLEAGWKTWVETETH